MDGARTIGQPTALAAVEAMLDSGVPQAVLLSGPSGVGKTTLALDLAAALLCTAAEGRPCRSCRACHLVEDGNHPDVHRIAPDGAGGQIRIDQVRALVPALALHSVEGGRRVAVVEQADRMNEDAQHALLKTLEEPPAGVTIVLCADDEDRLLPTIRSRVARVRLGTVGVRDIEALLSARNLAEPPEAGRVARAAAGRPGRAVAYARSPEALAARAEAARTLIDLLSAPRARRLALARDVLALGASAMAALDAARDVRAGADSVPSDEPAGRGRATRPARRATASNGATASAAAGGTGASEAAPESAPDQPDEPVRLAASERRRGLAWLIDIWTDVARDLALVRLAGPARVRDPQLLDDLVPISGTVDVRAVGRFLERIADTSRRLEANVSPELALDVLVLAWPGVRDAA
jgi:DNA polymerase III subunit delta'